MGSYRCTNMPIARSVDVSDSAHQARVVPLPHPVGGSEREARAGAAVVVAPIAKRNCQASLLPRCGYQSVKGMFAAGSLRTSIKYAVRKLRKGLMKGR